MRWLWAVPALALASGFATLGFWQQGRGDQKQQWLEAWESALVAEPAPFAQAADRSDDAPPLRVSGELRFRERPRLLLDNQQRDGRVGVRAYALADAEGLAQPLLVELGWLPMPADRALPLVEIPEDAQPIAGVLTPLPGQALKLAENPWPGRGDDGAPILLNFLSAAEIEAAVGEKLLHGVLRPDPELPIGYARDAVLLPNTLPPERHYGYAVQWWGLSATVIVVYLVLALRRSKR